MWGKGVGKWLAEDVHHCFMVRSSDFILGTTAALWKDIRFTSESHLRYIDLTAGVYFNFYNVDGGQK